MNNTEQKVLEKILKFHIHVDHETLDIHYYHPQRRKWYPKVMNQHPISGRFRANFGPKRSSVYRNRLVWMYFNRQPIPDTHFVDHIDGDNTNDHPSNLQLMIKKESHKQGNRMQTDNVLEELSDYFLTCGFCGYDPNR